MNNNTIKTIVTVAVLIVLFAIALSVLKTLFKIILPVAFVVVVGYILYKLFARR